MRISIGHVTRYTYGEPTKYSILALRLTPPSFQGQRVIEWKIHARGIEAAKAFRDGFGNTVHLVSCTDPHVESVIIAKGIVETEERAGIVSGLADPAPLNVYRRQTPMTTANEAIIALARETGMHEPGQPASIESMHRLMLAVRDAVDYQIGATNAHTTAAETLRDGVGVCQDHAHLFISSARALGVPARYVSGYLLIGDEPAEANHAWAEVWINDLGWVGFDPANRSCPTDHYVRLAAGLDSTFAAPIRGMRHGAAREQLDVMVEVQRHASQQQ
ncbi:transglutaminase family protein [Hyphomicrobium methylovorum]|uniref:transglutaminase family protein n=1 Tax=Hyphomicrobium methylovorum TaxID=84 RepID=UPI0015E66890|nr:transglutaminase family protein [Hyphomicrobium methylovorum]MBA2124729.1 transglutaminase family protein [Hyphomicrobium methylovorum]